ncbi:MULTISPECIES: hypothetical protein [unclassified Bradyrhizobium]|uniref:hypothetical protein n=1 Tax=unclassified Bradyrhizobium TaxID=2631580 RepID=UPI001BAB79D1|nr:MULTISPECIES: hypothetical protein [unclassified Bradyrhizobium]MBR1223412.1 hypothetical protein [Bradyrhizobium sp. AUGA SZCCT0176]MBR1298843.1 hypothetical protein [Bradyrhizobium sp. AUGA SZCCT0042]
MAMLPRYQNATTGGRHLFLVVIGVRKPVYWAVYSHAEWVEKTTHARSNRETFCSDCGELTQSRDLRLYIVSAQSPWMKAFSASRAEQGAGAPLPKRATLRAARSMFCRTMIVKNRSDVE